MYIHVPRWVVSNFLGLSPHTHHQTSPWLHQKTPVAPAFVSRAWRRHAAAVDRTWDVVFLLREVLLFAQEPSFWMSGYLGTPAKFTTCEGKYVRWVTLPTLVEKGTGHVSHMCIFRILRVCYVTSGGPLGHLDTQYVPQKVGLQIKPRWETISKSGTMISFCRFGKWKHWIKGF